LSEVTFSPKTLAGFPKENFRVWHRVVTQNEKKMDFFCGAVHSPQLDPFSKIGKTKDQSPAPSDSEQGHGIIIPEP